MQALIGRLKGVGELLLLAMVLISWGGSSEQTVWSGGGGGGFTGPDSTVEVEITADKTTLPVNIIGVGPSIGGAYTNTLTVTVKKNGEVFAAPNVSISIASGLSSGALFFLDGEADHEDDNGNPLAFRTLAFEDTTGVVSGHFHASSTSGTVVLTASTQDPDTEETISSSLTLTVTGGGSSTGGKPATVTFVMDSTPVYIRTNPVGTSTTTQSSVKLFQVFVQDDFGQPLNRGRGHVLKIEMLSGRPNGGEWLSAVDANGDAQEGTSVLTDPAGGAATVVFHSGSLPGTVTIAATADRADNNVKNGIQTAITNYATISVGTGEITSLTFSGPFVDAVRARLNSLGAQLVDPTTLADPFTTSAGTLWNGIFTRFITVLASDPFGNPPPAGTPITFRLIDSPLDMLQNRYPDQGHGQFAITGYNGDPAEGGWEFFAPNRTTARGAGDTLNPFVVPNGTSVAEAKAGCILMLQDPEIINANSSTINSSPAEGRLEYHIGSRLITGRTGNTLTVNSPFNMVSQNVGANVWYTVGCAPQKGNVMNFNTTTGGVEVNVTTDSNGIANTVVNYPSSQVGRRFMLAAEANGGKVGAVMTHWYLGIADGSTLKLIEPTSAVTDDGNILSVNVGEPLNQAITLQLVDGGVDSDGDGIPDKFTPIPGVPVAVEIAITDPAKANAIATNEAVTVAQANLTAFQGLNPTLICSPEPSDEDEAAKCETLKELEAALETAQLAAAEAKTLDELHNPTASITPTSLATGANGYAKATLHVSDLPSDGQVDFFFSTIGPEILTDTLTITVKPVAATTTTE